MKKLLMMSAAGLAIASVVGAAASADVFVRWETFKFRVQATEVATAKTWDIFLLVEQDDFAKGSAQAQALINATIKDSALEGLGEERWDSGSLLRRSVTLGSFNDNAGIAQGNQDSGYISNQGNTAAVALNLKGGSATMAEAYVDQENYDNAALLFASYGEFYKMSAWIQESLNYNSGILHFNQNSGFANNQHNALALALGDTSIAAISEAGLGQETAGNSILEWRSTSGDSMYASANGNSGIVNVNQSSGAMNNQATVYSIAITSASAALGG